MEKIDILLWIVGAGFTFNLGIMITMWNSLNSRMDRIELRMDKFDEKLMDIDRRMCRMEGSFASKDFCVMKSESKKEVG